MTVEWKEEKNTATRWLPVLKVIQRSCERRTASWLAALVISVSRAIFYRILTRYLCLTTNINGVLPLSIRSPNLISIEIKCVDSVEVSDTVFWL